MDEILYTQAELDEHLSKLTEQLENTKMMLKYANERQEGYWREIEQLHLFLDVLPNPSARKTEAAEEWQRQDISALLRLTTWLVVSKYK